MIGWPISSPSFCAGARPMMSDTPPAAYGTTSRIGLFGYPCPSAGAGSDAASAMMKHLLDVILAPPKYRLFQRPGEIGPAPAGDQPALRVEYLRLADGELAAELDHLALHHQIARHRGAVVVDAHVDGGHRVAGARGQRPVRAKIDQRGEDPAVRLLSIRVRHPLLAPGRLHLDEVLAAVEHFQAEPAVIRPSRDQSLEFFFRHGAHGVTTTLPSTSVAVLLEDERSQNCFASGSAAIAAFATSRSCSPVPEPTPIAPMTWPSTAMGSPPSRLVSLPPVANASLTSFATLACPDGARADAAVIAFLCEESMLTTLAPSMRTKASRCPPSSVIVMHCGCFISSALAIAARSIFSAPSWVSLRCGT